MRIANKRLGLLLSVAAGALLTGVGTAQAQSSSGPPPVQQSVDNRGVDLVSGALNLNVPIVAIGPLGSGGLQFARSYINGAARESYVGTLNHSGIVYTVSFGGSSEQFTFASGTYTSKSGDGATLVSGGSGAIYTAPDGTIANFGGRVSIDGEPYAANVGKLVSIQKTDGELISLSYTDMQICTDGTTTACGTYATASRLASVSNNLGYELDLTYAGNGSQAQGGIDTAYQITRVDAYNRASSSSPLISASLGETVSTSGGNHTITDALNRTREFDFDNYARITNYQPAQGSSQGGFTVAYDTSNRVTSWSNGVGTWTYAYSDNGSIRTTTVTDPNNHVRTIISDQTTSLVSSDADALNHATTYSYDSSSRVTQITKPEGGVTQFVYDARGNATTTTNIAKSGSGLANIVTTANYDASCSLATKCNKPNYTVDARGNRTDYTYDGASGLLTQIDAPAGANGIRPETRLHYDQLYAYYNGVQASSPVWRLTQASTCATQAGAACVGGADEMRVVTAYGSGTANNLLATSVTRQAGDGSFTATTTSTYTPLGDPDTVTGPLGSGTAGRYLYDAVRRNVGVIGPDPDGGGALKNRAIRLTYNVNDQPTLTERGTVASESNADWTNTFATLASTATAYDGAARPIQTTVSAGGTVNALSQVSYDNDGRVICSAVRMNPSAFSSPPGSACTQGTAGSFGPDRITNFSYDAADHPTATIDGYGTSLQRNAVAATYGADGEVLTQSDGKGNQTSYNYDGFDRLAQIFFPNASGSGSSTADYEQYSYDAGGNIVSDRRRDGQSISYGYDANGHVTSGANNATFAYDNLGRTTSAGVGGQSLSWTYDVLGDVKTETGPLGTVSSTYNAAGQRTVLTWPDGAPIGYSFDNAGEMTAVTYGGSSMVSYAYDDLGRRTSIGRLNGVSTGYGYGSDLRLSSLSHTFVDTSKNQSWTFASNPAGQITSATGSNTAYNWPSPASTNRNYTYDGQNKILTSGSLTISHDGRANLSNDGTVAYAYDITNKLTQVGSSATLSWDAANRLAQMVGSSTTRFLYDGDQIIGEYDGSGNMLRRYVPGASQDEPVVWAEGAGSSDVRWLVPDRQGSIAAVSNSSGSTIVINTYDEYGIPGSSNLGRFQYDGQAWLPEAGLYHARARAYSPTLGRFLQPDPIGYGDGMNLYTYVHDDPINAWDPTGTRFSLSGLIGGILGGLGFCVNDSVTTCLSGVVVTLQPSGLGDPNTRTIDPRGASGTYGGPNVVSGITVTAPRRSPMGMPQLSQDHGPVSCVGSAVYNNAGSLVLDQVGLAASIAGTLVPAYGLAAGGVGLIAGTGSLINSAFHRDLPAIGVGATGYYVGAISLGADGFAVAARNPLGRFAARSIPFLGIAVSVFALGYDSYSVYKDYQRCRGGG